MRGSRKGEGFSVKPCQIFLTERLDNETREEVLKGLDNMKHLKFTYKLINDAPGEGK